MLHKHLEAANIMPLQAGVDMPAQQEARLGT
jgi:hypothetical protein